MSITFYFSRTRWRDWPCCILQSTRSPTDDHHARQELVIESMLCLLLKQSWVCTRLPYLLSSVTYQMHARSICSQSLSTSKPNHRSYSCSKCLQMIPRRIPPYSHQTYFTSKWKLSKRTLTCVSSSLWAILSFVSGFPFFCFNFLCIFVNYYF